MLRISLIVLIILVSLPAFALVKFDFEDGTLQGFTVVSGDLGPQPTDNDNDRHHGQKFMKQGKFFIGTYEFKQDAAVGELRSPVFMISSEQISLLVGGGNHPDRTFVSLVRASDNEELFRETGTNAEIMNRKVWDVSKYKGEEVYIRIVDNETGGWGHINVDDIRELTPAEIAQAEKERKAREAALQKWYDDLMKPTPKKVYSGKELADLAVPMGGIGAGNIALCGDGALREWQIFNKVNSGCVLPNSFFAVWARINGKPAVTRALQIPAVGKFTGVKDIRFVGEFPVAELSYVDPSLPVQVSMQAFSPFIPMDTKNSGLPLVFYIFTLKNTGKAPVKASIAASLQNAVNYDGVTPVKGVEFKDYGGNLNTPVSRNGYRGVNLTNPKLDSKAKQFGSMVLGTLAGTTSTLAQWSDIDALYQDFSNDGVFTKVNPTPSEAGRTWNGAVAIPVDLKPGEKRVIPMFIAWYFPNLYADYDANLANNRIGHRYNPWFTSALDVADYAARNFNKLVSNTRLYRDTFFDTTLPYWFANKISSQASTLTSQTTLWLQDGTFAAFEGGGCCPMNCTHVYNYEQTISCLFPELERNMRKTDLVVQQEPTGAVHHRTVLPLCLPRGSGPFVDGHLGTVLKSYREYLRSADHQWLDDVWPRVRLAMNFVLEKWDPNKDGVLVNEQWNTYDAAMYGPNTFIGTLYLGALRAAEEMAKIEGDKDSAAIYRKVFETGSKRLDEVLWNGEYYIQIDTKADAGKLTRYTWLTQDWPDENSNPHVNRPYGKGCHADQLLGQWWAHILDLGYLLPEDRVNRALDSIMKYNWRKDFGTVAQQRAFAGSGDQGLLNCTWPNGGRPASYTLYSDEVWTGIEYEVAGLMLYEGRVKEAYQIVRAIDDRYNGIPRPPIKRNPWNEIECGEHYARAMSSWSCLLAAQGAVYNGPEGFISFNPVIDPGQHRSFFTGAEGWGTFIQKRNGKTQTDTLKLAYGSLKVNRLRFYAPAKVKSASLTLNGKPVRTQVATEGSSVTLAPSEGIMLKPRDILTASLKW